MKQTNDVVRVVAALAFSAAGIAAAVEPSPATSAPERQMTVAEVPQPRVLTQPATRGFVARARPTLVGPPVAINVESIPLNAFVNEVLGEALKVTFRIAPEVEAQQPLVTLRTPRPLAPADVYDLAESVLAEYGVALRFDDGVVHVELAATADANRPPLLVTGRAMPDVPGSHRPVFQLLDLEVVQAAEAARWLTTLFGERLKITEDPRRNALLINGKPADVKAAVDAVRVLDTPTMRGRTGRRVNPAFMPPNVLADRLVEVLSAQGVSAARGAGLQASVLLVPVVDSGALFVFANANDALTLALHWARELDKPNPTVTGEGFFYYQAKNTNASEILSIVSGQAGLGGDVAVATTPPGDAGEQTDSPASGAAGLGATGPFLLDAPRNALIFRGSAAEWERMLPLLQQVDRPARQVMVEVTIAEVTVDGSSDFGVSWFAKAGFGRFNGRLNVGALPGGSTGGGNNTNSGGGSGLTYLLDVAGQNRAALRDFAADSRVRILSTPRILVRSGKEASIDVGTEIPTVTSQSAAEQETGGTSNILQAIQYRSTGIILNVTPTVFSDDRIDLQISQEVSEALPLTDEATAGSPSIFNRSVSTNLTLRDGGSVVLGGLRSERQSDSDSGVPVLKDVPLVGSLFRTRGRTSNQTELIILIVPYVVEDENKAAAVSRAILDSQTEFEPGFFERRQLLPEEPATPPTTARDPEPLP